MSDLQGTLREIARQIRTADARRRMAFVSLRGRGDPALVVTILLATLLFGAAGWTLARIEDARGFLDPPVFAEIDDARILTDYRAQEAPIIDMVGHGTLALVGRSDGTIHTYDMARELFHEDRLPGASEGLSAPLALLSSACADDATCPASTPVFAATEAGGLAARANGRWQVLISDSAWIGRDGTRVDLDAVELWSLSDDGRWLLASAGEAGLGLFDQRQSLWIDVAQPPRGTWPSHINFAHGRFWLGGADGLSVFDPRMGRSLSAIPDVGEVLDLERAEDGNLLVLQSASCPGGKCLSILEARGTGDLRRLVGETAITPTLANGSISHAALQGGRFIVLGAAGVHSYDPHSRGWTVLEPGSVDAFHAATEGRSILFAAGTTVGRLSDGAVSWRVTVSDRVTQILPWSGNTALVLLRDGSVVDVNRPETPIVPVDLLTGDPSRITTAATTSDTVVLISGSDAILHDPASRRWAVQPQALPPGAGAQLRLHGTRDALWLVDESQGRIWSGTVSGTWPNRTVSFDERQAGLGRLVSARASGRDLYVVDADQRPWRLQSVAGAPPMALVGPDAPAGFTPITMTAAADQLVFSDGRSVASYSYLDRGWSGPAAGPPGGIQDLAFAQPGVLVALSQDSVLFGWDAQGWGTVSGSPGGLPIGSNQIDDALAAGQSIFLAGSGQVVEYRPDFRRVGAVFSGGQGAVRLVGMRNGLPVWLSGARLLIGDEIASLPSERVIAAGQSQTELVYMAEEAGRRHAVSLTGAVRRCLFRGTAPPGGRLVDARGLSDGRVFVATTEATALYEPLNRRWVALQGNGVRADARIEIVAGHLAILEGTAFRAAPLSALPAPHSCDASIQAIDWVRLSEIAQVTHDGAADRLLILGRDGALQQWQGGPRNVLPSVGEAPVTADLRRVRSDGDTLIFGSDRALWTYASRSRTWQSRQFVNAPSTVSVLDLEIDAGRSLVTLWDDAGRGYGGQAETGPITVRPLTVPSMPRPTQDPSRLRDMAMTATVVAVLGERSLELFARDTHTTIATLRLPAARSGWRLAEVPGAVQLVLSDGDLEAPQRLFVLDLQRLRNEIGADLADVAFVYEPGNDQDWALTSEELWRIDASLALYRCAVLPGASASSTCQQAARSPEPLNPDDLAAAVALENGETLVLVGSRILRFNAQHRLMDRLALPGLGTVGHFLRHGADVFLWAGQSRPLWRWSDDGAAEELFSGVLDLRPSAQGLAAITPEGLFLLAPDGTPTRPVAGDIPLSAATIGQNGRIVGLGADGRVRVHGEIDTPLSHPRLPETSVAVTLAPAPRFLGTPEGDVLWAQGEDGSVTAHWFGECAPLPVEDGVLIGPPPPPEAPTVSTPGAELSPEQLPETGTETSPDPGAPERVETEPVALTDLDASATDGSMEFTPEDTFVTCLQTWDSGLSLAESERMLDVATRQGQTTIVTTFATYALGEDETAAVARVADWEAELPGGDGALDAVRRRIRDIGGQSFYAPPSFIYGAGSISMDAGTGVRSEGTGGTLSSPAPFSLGWLSWDRATGLVRFGEELALAPADAIRNGRFLPDIAGRAAYLGGDSFALLNPHGLWRVRIGSEVRPVRTGTFALPSDLAGGRFLGAGDGIDARSGADSPDNGSRTVILGALTITEALRGGGLRATYRISGRDLPGFAQTGFQHDRRLAVTAQNGAAFLATPIGLVPVTDLGEGVALPAGIRAIDTEGADALALTAQGWQRLDGANWTASAPPWHDRVLAVESGRLWQRNAGTVGVASRMAGEPWRTARQGLAFEADRLIALAADPAGIVMITGVGSHEGQGLAALAALGAPVAPDPGIERLDARTAHPGRWVLWADTAAGKLVWDRGNRSWRPARVDEDVRVARRAVETQDFRIDFRQGRAEPAIRVTDLDGSMRHAGFDWSAGQDLPFDRARAVTIEGESVLLGTDFGLRRLRWNPLGIVSEALFSGTQPNAPPRRFDRVGRPETEPSRLLAEASGVCFELSSPVVPPVPCAMSGDLSQRWVFSDAIWGWYKTDTVVVGTYRDANGQPVAPARLRNGGRWPHDRLRELVPCGDALGELWAEADLVTTRSTGRSDHLTPLDGVSRLHCQVTSAELGQGATLAPGLHAVGARAAWRWNGQSWQADTNAPELLDRVAGMVPWEAGRLRLRLGTRGLDVETRGLDDLWRPLPWIGGRPAIDHVHGIAAVRGDLYLVTPAGVLEWSVTGHRLDPETLLLRTPTDRTALADCRPRSIETLDGSLQAVPSQVGDPVDILCSDGDLWRGTLTTPRDAGVFVSATSDIAGERVLIKTPDWVWTRRIGPSGEPFLDVDFRSETAILSGGRWSLDDYTGIAAPYADSFEVVTQSAGWWRSPRRDLSLGSIRRAGPGSQAETATRLHSDLIDDAPHLCVSAAASVYVAPDNSVARAPICRDVRGRDNVWTWYSSIDGAGAEGLTIDGIGLQRSLTEGRFDDLFLVAAPLEGPDGRVIAPTRTGALVLGRSGLEGIFRSSEPGFLAPDPTDVPILLTRGGAVDMLSSGAPACAALSDLPALLPDGTVIMRARRIAPDAMEVVVSDAVLRTHLLVPCASVRDTLAWSMPIDVRHRARFRAIGGQVLGARLDLQSRDQTLRLTDRQRRAITFDTETSGPVIAQVAAQDGGSVVVATSDRLYRLDVDQALVRLAAAGAAETLDPAFAPAGPFFEPPPAAQPQTDPLPPTSSVPESSSPPATPPVSPPANDIGAVTPPAPPPLDTTIAVVLDRNGWRQVQSALRARGFDSGSIDGLPGPRTRSAIEQWQAATGFPPTSVLTVEQHAKLLGGGT